MLFYFVTYKFCYWFHKKKYFNVMLRFINLYIIFCFRFSFLGEISTLFFPFGDSTSSSKQAMIGQNKKIQSNFYFHFQFSTFSTFFLQNIFIYKSNLTNNFYNFDFNCILIYRTYFVFKYILVHLLLHVNMWNKYLERKQNDCIFFPHPKINSIINFFFFCEMYLHINNILVKCTYINIKKFNSHLFNFFLF